jgi:hypothetical protein
MLTPPADQILPTSNFKSASHVLVVVSQAVENATFPTPVYRMSINPIAMGLARRVCLRRHPRPSEVPEIPALLEPAHPPLDQQRSLQCHARKIRPSMEVGISRGFGFGLHGAPEMHPERNERAEQIVHGQLKSSAGFCPGTVLDAGPFDQ